ncbi:MAG: hypothetical protein KC476_01375 [Cyanobacteria bacterium HKST-UBA06]|nr:hypothetical protein [Cyanobacteria bacterium HKST-UBA05]MCA9806581.1 hypothetical protein [Cyanobacteria bacterium HKST-UBA06]MCA9841240.1 hypothetical protein [Cyanobacteria bacterium HKST-UBA03]
MISMPGFISFSKSMHQATDAAIIKLIDQSSTMPTGVNAFTSTGIDAINDFAANVSISAKAHSLQ